MNNKNDIDMKHLTLLIALLWVIVYRGETALPCIFHILYNMLPTKDEYLSSFYFSLHRQ